MVHLLRAIGMSHLSAANEAAVAASEAARGSDPLTIAAQPLSLLMPHRIIAFDCVVL